MNFPSRFSFLLFLNGIEKVNQLGIQPGSEEDRSLYRPKRIVILDISNPGVERPTITGGVVYRDDSGGKGGAGGRGGEWRRLDRLIVGRPGFLASTVRLICFLATRFLRSDHEIAGLSALREARRSFWVLEAGSISEKERPAYKYPRMQNAA